MNGQNIRLEIDIFYSQRWRIYYSDVENYPLGKLLKSLHEMDRELGYSKIKEKDYEFLNEIREIRNYWCHQCYIKKMFKENSYV